MADDYIALCTFMQQKLKPLIAEMTLLKADDDKPTLRGQHSEFATSTLQKAIADKASYYINQANAGYDVFALMIIEGKFGQQSTPVTIFKTCCSQQAQMVLPSPHSLAHVLLLMYSCSCTLARVFCLAYKVLVCLSLTLALSLTPAHSLTPALSLTPAHSLAPARSLTLALSLSSFHCTRKLSLGCPVPLFTR